MSLNRARVLLLTALVTVLAVFGSAPRSLAANDQSIDGTMRLLALPLAECVSKPNSEAENRFKIELAGGRWHVRNEYYSINLDIAGTSFSYARFITPAYGINIHADASYLKGHNAEMDIHGYGLETGMDFMIPLGSAPSAAGPLNGSSLFIGFLGWISKLEGDYFHGVIIIPGPTDEIAIHAVSYQLRVGWQGRLWMKRVGSGSMYLEPAVYAYLNNAHRSVQIIDAAADDDVNPTSYGVSANLHLGIGNDVLMPGDRMAVGVAGAWGFGHNNSYQFNIAYSFGAFNPVAGE